MYKDQWNLLETAAEKLAHITLVKKRKRNTPASHENGLVCTKLLSVHQDSDIGENVSAAQPIQVKQDIACMACKLYAAVCCASHLVKFCKQTNNNNQKTKIISHKMN